jgi:hypothetical protein
LSKIQGAIGFVHLIVTAIMSSHSQRAMGRLAELTGDTGINQIIPA